MNEGTAASEASEPKSWRRKTRRKAVLMGKENDPGQEVDVIKRLQVTSQANHDNDSELRRNKPPHW